MHLTDMETAVGNRPESRQDRSCAHPDHVTPGAKPLWTKNPQLIGAHPACDNGTEQTIAVTVQSFPKIALPNQGRSSSPLLPSIQGEIHNSSPNHTAVLTASIPCTGPDVTSHSQKEESRQELLTLATK